MRFRCFQQSYNLLKTRTLTWKHQLHTNTTHIPWTRTPVIHNYQPQAKIYYILLTVFAIIIETLDSFLFQELSVSYITLLLFE
jgi:hypothetical protein